MSSFRRGLYGVIVRMHPADFRSEFGREMMLDFEDALHTYGLGRLWRDALWSLARQWSACVLSGGPEQSSAPRPSLLAGQYVMIREERLTVIELGRGLVVSVTFIALCGFGLRGAPRAFGDLPIVYASPSTPATGRNANPGSRLPDSEDFNSDFKVSRGAVAAFAPTGTASTTLSSGSASAPTLGVALGGVAQTRLIPELLLFHPPALCLPTRSRPSSRSIATPPTG